MGFLGLGATGLRSCGLGLLGFWGLKAFEVWALELACRVRGPKV